MEYFVEVIKENKFVPIAEKAAMRLLSFAAYYADDREKIFSKRLYVALVKESMELEDFLDDHGARNNKIWVYFGEIVASIRNLASTAYMVSHILNRLKFYRLRSSHTKEFIRDSQRCLQFLNTTIIRLFSHLDSEARTLGLRHDPESRINENDFSDNMIVQVLPQNINDEGVDDINENIIRVASEFIDSYNESGILLFEKKIPKKKLDSTIIPGRINEETLRHIETHVHNAQSMYDTYIQKTPIESEHTILKSLRGHISVTLHLLGIAKSLSHFHERHEISVRSESTRVKIDKIVDKKKVLDITINYALYYYTIILEEGVELANEITGQFTVVDTVTVNVPEGLGFHLRPSTLVAKIANHYGANLTMIVSDKEFDAGSVIDIMWAAGIIKKEEITRVQFKGDKNAVRDIQLLASCNYGEDTMGNSTPLPEELSYLRQE